MSEKRNVIQNQIITIENKIIVNVHVKESTEEDRTVARKSCDNEHIQFHRYIG